MKEDLKWHTISFKSKETTICYCHRLVIESAYQKGFVLCYNSFDPRFFFLTLICYCFLVPPLLFMYFICETACANILAQTPWKKRSCISMGPSWINTGFKIACLCVSWKSILFLIRKKQNVMCLSTSGSYKEMFYFHSPSYIYHIIAEYCPFTTFYSIGYTKSS